MRRSFLRMEYVSEVIKQGGKFLFCFLWILVGTNIFIWRVEYGKFHKRFFEKLGNAFFFLLTISFFSAVLAFHFQILYWILIGILGILCVVELVFYCEYASLFTSNTFLVIAETNVEESKEFLHDLLSWKLAKNLCIITFFILGCPLFLAPIFEVFARSQLGQYFLFFLLFVAMIDFLQAHRPKKIIRYYMYFPFFRLSREYYFFVKQRKENIEAFHMQKKIEENLANILTEKKEIDIIVFIIGESASRNYLEIYNSYGNYFNNSPYMKERLQHGELFVFDNVISSESLTALSIPKMMTFKNYENEKEWYCYPNMISILKKAGYTTYWISNQIKNETVGKVFSSLADHCFFSEDVKDKPEKYDGILLEEGIQILRQEKKKAIFFHLQGSHNTYSKKYPQEFDIDKAEDIKENIAFKRKKYLAEYSNSLRYTDYILDSIFHFFSEEKTICFYMSDHAEEFWENREFRGHSGDSGSRFMIEIPMFIFISQRIRDLHPDIVEACMQSLHKPYMTDDIIHTVLGVLGVKAEGYEEKRNVLSQNFDSSRKRIYQGKDYDEFWKLQKISRGV